MNDGIHQLVAAAERDGTVALPALSEAELCTLGAAGTSLVCVRTWAWWTGLSERERAGLAVRSPTRNPQALRAALRECPWAAPVEDHLPPQAIFVFRA
ncbi:MAG TPA: hypothetical protein VMG38_01330 [Trebonia sp.]|nr:hypothetical protein [Trebonia sp.]